MSSLPEVGSVWEHSGGGRYRVIQLANEHSTNDRYPLTVVYQGVPSGKVWSRPMDQWHRSMTLVAPPAAAPVAAGEPVAEFFVEFATLRRAMSIYGLSAPESNHELGSQMERYAIRVIEAVARLPFPYPPAAAHGDEAVRKDPNFQVQRDELLAALAEFYDANQARLKLLTSEVYLATQRLPGMREALYRMDDAQRVARKAIDAAMRAQGDGEVQ